MDTSVNRKYFVVLKCSICGTLHSVDQFLNIKLTDISVTDPEKYPHMVRTIRKVENKRIGLSIFII